MPGEAKTFYYPLYQEYQDTNQQDTIRQDSIRQDTIPQDTIQVTPQDTTSPMEDTIKPLQETQKDTSQQEDLNQSQSEKLDSLTRAEEKQFQRKKEQIIQQEKEIQIQQKAFTEKEEQDTTLVLYQITGATDLPILQRLKDDPAYINFMYNMPSTRSDSSNTNVYKNLQQKQHTLTEQPSKPKMPEPDLHKREGLDWISFLIIALFIFLGWTRLFFKRYFNTLFKSFHFINYAEELYNEKSSITIRGATFLNGVYFIVLGLFTLQGVEYFFTLTGIAKYKLFGIFTGFFIIWYIWNAFFKQFIGSVFQKLKTFTEYFYNYGIYRKIAGIVLFPVVVINQYVHEELTMYFIYTGILIFAVIYLIHILRGLQIFMKNKVSILYFVLYLCALEFLPLLVLYEWVTNKF